MNTLKGYRILIYSIGKIPSRSNRVENSTKSPLLVFDCSVFRKEHILHLLVTYFKWRCLPNYELWFIVNKEFSVVNNHFNLGIDYYKEYHPISNDTIYINYKIPPKTIILPDSFNSGRLITYRGIQVISRFDYTLQFNKEEIVNHNDFFLPHLYTKNEYRIILEKELDPQIYVYHQYKKYIENYA